MADWLPVAAVATPAQARRGPVGLREGQAQSAASWLREVDAWQAAFAARVQARWALYFDDPLRFAAALFGAWHAGKAVALPGDAQPATLALLRSQGWEMAGDAAGATLQPQADAEPQPREALDLEATRLSVYTSGSTGEPAAIDKRLSQLASEVDALQAAFAPLVGDALAAVWSTVSHQHIYGLLFLVLWPLAAGRLIAVRRLLYPEDLAERLGPAPSILVSSPAHLRRLAPQLDWRAARSGLRAVFSSGGPLPFEAAQASTQLLGRTPIEVFGSSETGGIAWRQCDLPDRPWQPFADVHWQLRDGLLAVRSPRLGHEAWWPTSDQAEAAGTGFRLRGRADRIVKIEEKRVSLDAVERQLAASPWIAEARALLVDTPIGARIGVAAVLTQEGRGQLQSRGKRALSGALRAALADALEAVALPRRWRFVETLPFNAQGKTTEAALRALFDPEDPAGLPPLQWSLREPQQALAVLDVQAGLPVFDGHFPDVPVLPGVAQLDWAIALGRLCFDMPPHLLRIEALKFVRPVLPPAALLAELSWTPAADGGSLHFRLYTQAGDGGTVAHASGRVLWTHHAPGTQEPVHG